MKLYIARHGETDWNKVNKIQGREDISMNQKGIEQVMKVSEGLKNIKFEKIYSSPLDRALQTAKLISGSEDIIIDETIYEIGFGALEGLEYGDIRGKEKKDLNDDQEKIWNFFEAPHKYKPIEGGESYEDLINRVNKFLKEMKSKHAKNENVLVVTHSTFIHALVSVVENIPISKLWKITIPNCSVTILEPKDDGYKVLELGKVYN